jgi:hypothetical protein
MKKRYLLFILFAGLLSCKTSRETAYRERQSEGMEENLSQRVKWEIERQANPKTGKIPFMIRDKEQTFAASLPGNQPLRGTTVNSWSFRGPWNLGGRTRAFAVDVTNDNILLAGAVSGGMWRSTDAGASWTRVSGLNSYQGSNAIAQDKRPGQTNTWYYMTGEAYGTSASAGGAFYLGNGIYKSIDGGITWTSLPSTVSNTPQSFDNVWDVTWNIVTDPGNQTQDVLYAATYDAIYKSVNGGTSWTLARGNAGTQTLQAYFTDVAVATNSVVYCTLSSDGPVATRGIWRSVDGISWTNITPANFPLNYDRQVIEIDPNNPNVVYFFGPTPGYGRRTIDWQGDTLYNSLWKYEYQSGNGSGVGGTWTDLSQNLPGDINAFNGLNTQGGYDVVVKVKPGSSNVIFIGGTNIYRSTSGFTDSLNTTVMGGYEIGAALPFVNEYPGHHPDQHVVAFLNSDPNKMYSASDGGVSFCDDNTAANVVWTEKNNGYLSGQFYTVAIDPNTNDDIVMGGLQDNGTYWTNTTNGLSPWTHSFDGDGSYCAIGNSQYYYFSKQLGKIFKTTIDANGNFTAYRRIDPIGATNYRFIAPFVLDPNNNNIMYLCANQSIWRNDDLSAIALTNQADSISQNWVNFNDTLSIAGEVITALAISNSPANRLYYGTNKKNIYRVDNANVGNPTRVSITATTFPANGYVNCIAVNPNNADEILAVFSNYSVYSLFHSTDGGITWVKAAGNLEATVTGSGNGPSLRWASILPVNGGTVYLVGGSTGLYATDAISSTATIWVQQGVNTIGRSIVDMIATRPADGLVVVATHGNGMFSSNITSVNDIVSVKENDLSSAVTVYPNPVGKELQIQFNDQLNDNDWVGRINDEIGRIIMSDISIKGSTGINVQQLVKGVYFLILESKGQKITKPFVKN